MKKKLYVLLLIVFISPTAFAQLNKSTLEEKFPLLNLPYELGISMIPLPEKNGRADVSKYPFLKDDVTTMVFDAMKDENNNFKPEVYKKSISSPTAKINAIGRISIGKQNFIVYNLNDAKSDAYINVVYVASLDDNYKIVDISNIAFYAIFANEDKSYRVTRILRNASLSNNKLILKETDRFIKNVASDGKESLNTQISTTAYIFNADGKTERLMIITK